MTIHYLEQMKNERMNFILAGIRKAKVCWLKELKAEIFEKRGMSPILTMKYLKELEDLGFIEIDEANNQVKIIKRK